MKFTQITVTNTEVFALNTNGEIWRLYEDKWNHIAPPKVDCEPEPEPFTQAEPYDANGTSLQSYIGASPAALVAAIGAPHVDGDSYKVSAEWIFKDSKGNVFTIYDWKNTDLYEPGYGDPKQFLESHRPYEWHIGAKSGADTTDFKAWLRAKLNAQ